MGNHSTSCLVAAQQFQFQKYPIGGPYSVVIAMSKVSQLVVLHHGMCVCVHVCIHTQFRNVKACL